MPLKGTALKRWKISERNRLRRKPYRTRIKTMTKKYLEALEQGELEQAQAALREALRSIDKAASKHAIHKRQADRRKSRLARKLNALRTATSKATEEAG